MSIDDLMEHYTDIGSSSMEDMMEYYTTYDLENMDDYIDNTSDTMQEEMSRHHNGFARIEEEVKHPYTMIFKAKSSQAPSSSSQCYKNIPMSISCMVAHGRTSKDLHRLTSRHDDGATRWHPRHLRLDDNEATSSSRRCHKTSAHAHDLHHMDRQARRQHQEMDDLPRHDKDLPRYTSSHDHLRRHKEDTSYRSIRHLRQENKEAR
jgi:hypothetical protein